MTELSGGIVVQTCPQHLPLLDQVCGVIALLRFEIALPDEALVDPIASELISIPDQPKRSESGPCTLESSSSFPSEQDLARTFSSETIDEILALQAMLLSSELHAEMDLATNKLSLRVGVAPGVALMVVLDKAYPETIASVDVDGPDLWTSCVDVRTVLREIQDNMPQGEGGLLHLYFMAKDAILLNSTK
eukprot:c9904_g1_i1.p1 GENE.c9904_g1_i1~~c9904_g1_i1.p1  ORF type:complete len:190 (+),score=46.57 c9904_g1_i1:357-926(+)